MNKKILISVLTLLTPLYLLNAMPNSNANIILTGDDRNIYHDIKSAIDTKSIKEFKEIIEKGNWRYKNLHDESCLTPLALVYAEIKDTNFRNIDKVMKMIQILEAKKAFQFNYKDLKVCKKQYKNMSKRITIKTDEEVLQLQLQKFRAKVNIDVNSYKGKNALINKLDEIVNKFNASLFSTDGNYIKLKVNKYKIVTVSANIQIADWNEEFNEKRLYLDVRTESIINKIDISTMVRELSFIFKNQKYINQIIQLTNRELVKLEKVRNKMEEKKITTKIKSYKASYDYILRGNITQILLLKKLFSKIK